MNDLRNALRSFRRAFRFLAIALVVCGGCSRYERADLVIVNGPEPLCPAPPSITGAAHGRIALTIFEGLPRYNPTNATPLPGLAERWDISPDGRVYTFHIRSNAVWSTGEPLTAHDFVYSWLRVLKPATGADYAAQLYYVKGAEAFNTLKDTNPNNEGVTALNDKTLRVELLDRTP